MVVLQLISQAFQYRGAFTAPQWTSTCPGHELRGLKMGSDGTRGKKGDAVLEGGQYVAVVVDGKMKTYG